MGPPLPASLALRHSRHATGRVIGRCRAAIEYAAARCGSDALHRRLPDMASPGAKLRRAWADGPIMIPGAFNALAARMAERLGFRAAYLSGGALSAGWAGLPDIGLLTLTEFVEQAAVLTGATSLPVLCDADTGFGEAVNVERAVRLFEG